MEKHELFRDIGQYNIDKQEGKTTPQAVAKLEQRIGQLADAIKHSYWDKLVCTISPEILRFCTELTRRQTTSASLKPDEDLHDRIWDRIPTLEITEEELQAIVQEELARTGKYTVLIMLRKKNE